MKKRICALTLAVLLSFSIFGCASEKSAEPVFQPSASQTELEVENGSTALEEYAQLALDYSGASSVQYALWDSGEVRLSGQAAVSDRLDPEPLTQDSLYGIASISKLYAVTAILQLEDAGLVDLDDPVTAYLPDFRMRDSRYTQITLRMLLNHSAGFQGGNNHNAMLFADGDETVSKEILGYLADQALAHEPGAFSTYCNVGFTLAERVVEAVTGEDFQDYVWENIISPAGLHNTFTLERGFDSERREKTWYWVNTAKPMPMESVTQISGIGGFYATAEDVAAFGGRMVDGTLFSSQSLAQMTAPEYRNGFFPENDTNFFTYGLGWDSVVTYPFQQNGILALSKCGDSLVYHSALVVLPEYQLSAAVLFCGGTSDVAALLANQLLIQELEGRGGISVDTSLPPIVPGEAAEIPKSLRTLAGYYGSTMQQFQVEFTENTLNLTNLDLGKTKYFTYCQDGFFYEQNGIPWRLRLEKHGSEVYLYHNSYDDYGELGLVPWSQYTAIRLEENPISEELQTRWDRAYYARLPVNEKYTSMEYTSVTPYAQLAGSVQTKIPGYVDAVKILDETHAVFSTPLPGNAGREGTDLTLEQQGDMLYLHANSRVFLGEGSIPDMEHVDSVTIPESGYAQWFRVNNLAGVRMTVACPESSGFYVYGENGSITASSVMWGDTSALLPENGYLVFIGEPGMAFELTFSEQEREGLNGRETKSSDRGG